MDMIQVRPLATYTCSILYVLMQLDIQISNFEATSLHAFLPYCPSFIYVLVLGMTSQNGYDTS